MHGMHDTDLTLGNFASSRIPEHESLPVKHSRVTIQQVPTADDYGCI